jgi:hypothetical protein
VAHDDPPDVPRIGKPIPNAGGARVDLAKLVRYALDPDHPVGRHKATVFQRTLGIERPTLVTLRVAPKDRQEPPGSR